jgi:hypothetical protein
MRGLGRRMGWLGWVVAGVLVVSAGGAALAAQGAAGTAQQEQGQGRGAGPGRVAPRPGPPGPARRGDTPDPGGHQDGGHGVWERHRPVQGRHHGEER